MQLKDFDFELPEHLIARYPLAERSASRLLVLNPENGMIQHRLMPDVLEYLSANDLLVFNNTKVIPARLFAQKTTGGKVELLVERLIDEHRIFAQVKSSKGLRLGSELLLAENIRAEVLGRKDALYELKFITEKSVMDILNKIGHMPLPPYMNRADETLDQERYQTIFAEKEGAVACPTAGLHFDEMLLQRIKTKGVETACITLHVGAGTFQPIRAERIEDHTMHSEVVEVSAETVEKIKQCKKRGGKVWAIGTTAVRSLETASQSGDIQTFQGETNIFIYPSYRFHCVDALITNFHFPQSTLLLLVSAFAGYDNIRRAYREAIQQHYRFFSYGDAMLIQSVKKEKTYAF